MRIAVLGTGIVGRVIASRLAELGHDVTIGTRDVSVLLARTERDRMGNEPFVAWRARNPQVALGSFAEAATAGELVVNATNGAGSLDALQAAGAEHLNDKVLIDVANALDFSRGMPPSLLSCNTDSLAERIQRSFPAAKVVKTLNTVNPFMMANPSLITGGEHAVFVSGNDETAKARVTEILRAFGWRQIIDLGDITSARGPEMYVPLWFRLLGALETRAFNISVVR
jgi:predicted dinucleotide-binding enzyme